MRWARAGPGESAESSFGFVISGRLIFTRSTRCRVKNVNESPETKARGNAHAHTASPSRHGAGGRLGAGRRLHNFQRNNLNNFEQKQFQKTSPRACVRACPCVAHFIFAIDMLGAMRLALDERLGKLRNAVARGPAKPIPNTYVPTFVSQGGADSNLLCSDELDLLRGQPERLAAFGADGYSRDDTEFEREPDTNATIKAKKRRGFEALMHHRWVTHERKAYRRLRREEGKQHSYALHASERASYRNGFTAFDGEFDGCSMIVRVCNLTYSDEGRRAEGLNGMIGMLGSLDMATGRYDLSLATGERLLVRPHNIERVQAFESHGAGGRTDRRDTGTAPSSSGVEDDGAARIRDLLTKDASAPCQHLEAKLLDGMAYADLSDPNSPARKELLFDLRRVRRDWSLPLGDVMRVAELAVSQADKFPGRSKIARRLLTQVGTTTSTTTTGHGTRTARQPSRSSAESVGAAALHLSGDDLAPRSSATKSSPNRRVESASSAKASRRVDAREAQESRYAAQTSSAASAFGHFTITTQGARQLQKRAAEAGIADGLADGFCPRGRAWPVGLGNEPAAAESAVERALRRRRRESHALTPRQSVFNPFNPHAAMAHDMVDMSMDMSSRSLETAMGRILREQKVARI